MTASEHRRRDELIREFFRHRDALLWYAFVILRNWADAEDALQEAAVFVMRNWQDCRGASEVYPWARRVVYFRSMELLHSRRPENVSLDAEEELLAEVAAAVDEQAVDAAEEFGLERKNALRECISALERNSRALLRMFYWEQATCADIAARLKRSEVSVRVALHRLRNALRECVAQKLQGAVR